MKVLYITAECKPFSKAGGVGDVAGELPPALKAQGVDIEIVTPWYGQVQLTDYAVDFNGQTESIGIVSQPEVGGVPVNFIKNARYFEGAYGTPYVHSDNIPFKDDILRFSFFSEACLHLIEQKKPDIVHVNDWVLGYLLGRMEIEGFKQKRVLTVHNIGYQGTISREVIEDWSIAALDVHSATASHFADPRTEWNSVNALKLGLGLADQVNTVSPTYAEEICEEEDLSRFFEGGKGLHEVTSSLKEAGKLSGILNGFEYPNKPSSANFKAVLKKKSDARAALSGDFENPEGMLLGFVGRAVEQKFGLLTETLDGKSVLEHILDLPDINVAIVATGLPEYEAVIRHASVRPNCSATLAFDRAKAAQVSQGSDVFLMPSLFEPCGITQMESMSCGTPPLVRWTGGLADTVKPHTERGGTGFGFNGDSRESILRNLIQTVSDAKDVYTNQPDHFRALQSAGYKSRFHWSKAAEQYVSKTYEPALSD